MRLATSRGVHDTFKKPFRLLLIHLWQGHAGQMWYIFLVDKKNWTKNIFIIIIIQYLKENIQTVS